MCNHRLNVYEQRWIDCIFTDTQITSKMKKSFCSRNKIHREITDYYWITEFQARYVDIDGRIGLVNGSGEILVNAIYDDISMFDENGLAITTRTIDGETFCGLINKDGVQIVDDSAFCYIDVGYHSALGNSARYGVYEARTQNGKLCFLFADGTVGMYPDFSALGNTTREDAMNINSFFVNGSVFLRSVKGWCLYSWLPGTKKNLSTWALLLMVSKTVWTLLQ